MSSRLRSLLPALGGGTLLLIGTIALFAEVLFQGRVFFFGDLSLYFLPQLAFLREELRAGRIPLWNPYILGGQPFVGNPQTWPLYPSTLLLFFFEAERANSLSTVLQVLWAALGMGLFLRSQGRSWSAATLGAAVFSFGGAFISKAQFPNMLQAMTWLPWLLWAVERVIEQASARRIAALAGCIGLAVLAAHAQVTLMQLYVALAWVVFRLRGIPRADGRAALKALALATALGALLAMAQVLPMLEHTLASTRPQLSLTAANRFYMPWFELVLLIFPNFYGNPAFPNGWSGKANFWEPCCYTGLVALGLLVVVWRSRKRETVASAGRFWGWTAALSLWLAMGKYAGLYLIAFYLLPGVRQFHDPARWLYICTFAFATLAAQGLDTLRVSERLRWLFVVVAALDLVFFARTLNPTCEPAVLARGRERLAKSLAGTERVFHTKPFLPWRQFVPRKTYSPLDIEAFIASGTPNLPFWVGIRQLGGYEPVGRRDIVVALKALGKLPVEPAALTTEQREKLETLGVGRIYGAESQLALPTQRALVEGGAVLAQRAGEYRIQVASGAASVVVRETAASGWRATVDGTPRPIERADGVFLSVPVAPDEKIVVFRYQPLSWTVGVFLSGASACILVGLMLFGTRIKQWRN